jgi:hypothetical protein
LSRKGLKNFIEIVEKKCKKWHSAEDLLMGELLLLSFFVEISKLFLEL